ncbi:MULTISPECIES: hypothetical protein [unclassified Streptomyces]|uniref:hypothetical protein n=1 Tax=Streptomyces sp. NPDC055082 TaxID=3365718 RepID=UPI0037D34BA9
MARRTMAERKRRAAERETRRESLLVLLSRMQRGALLDVERPLLRAHVETELSDANELRRTVAGQQTLIQRQAVQLDAAHDAIREAEQDAADVREQLLAYRAVEAQRRAEHRQALSRLLTIRSHSNVRAFLDEQTAHLPTPEQP